MAQRSKKKWILTSAFIAVICALVVIAPFLLRTFVVQAFKIPSGAMKPTLLVGDHILVNKLPKAAEQIERGDIIVFSYPPDPRKDFIKRVVGLPGDLFEIRDKQIFVNSNSLKEGYIIHTDKIIIPASVRPRDNFGPLRVPKGSLFVLGDNRDASFDSRFWGFVELSKVKGRVTKIYWSWDKENSQVRWDRIGQTVH
jgi:signal peptidase I